MSEITQDEALRRAAALVTNAVKETEARCAVLGQFIDEANGSKTLAWSDALRELHALHAYRIGLLRRHSLIEQALNYPVGECPASVPLPPLQTPTVRRTQQQVQIRAQRRRS
jgi:hypothetical protein